MSKCLRCSFMSVLVGWRSRALKHLWKGLPEGEFRSEAFPCERSPPAGVQMVTRSCHLRRPEMNVSAHTRTRTHTHVHTCNVHTQTKNLRGSTARYDNRPRSTQRTPCVTPSLAAGGKAVEVTAPSHPTATTLPDSVPLSNKPQGWRPHWLHAQAGQERQLPSRRAQGLRGQGTHSHTQHCAPLSLWG